MCNQSVNEFYDLFLFKLDAIPQYVVILIDTAEKVFNNLSPNMREFLISEGVQVPPRPPTETNHQGNQMFFLVRNAAVEAENKTRTIKALVQPESRIHHTITLIGMLGGKPSINMAGLGIIFKSMDNNSMVSEALGEYVLASAEASYEDTGKHAPIVFMESVEEHHEYVNFTHWLDHKTLHFPAQLSQRKPNWIPPRCA